MAEPSSLLENQKWILEIPGGKLHREDVLTAIGEKIGEGAQVGLFLYFVVF